MKKSLVALFALSSAAMGVTLEDAVATGTGTLSLDNSIAAITAVAVIDVVELQTLMARDAELSKNTIINFDADNDIGIQTNYNSYNHDGDNVTANVISVSGLYGCWNNGGAYSVGMDTGTGFQDASFWANGAIAAITLTYEYSKGTTATFVLLDAEGNELKSLGGTFSQNLKGSGLTFSTIVFDDIVTEGYVFEQVVTADEAKELGKAAAAAELVPEPTTATLSLLALAGLAARRRRR